MYLLDTVFLSEVRKRPQSRAMVWMRQQNVTELFLSAITVMEIERGIEQQRRPDPPFAAALEKWLRENIMLFGNRILPITTAIAQRWGRMQIQLKRDDDDIAIAATALEHNFQVVTRNVRHFDKTGVVVFNPFEAP